VSNGSYSNFKTIASLLIYDTEGQKSIAPGGSRFAIQEAMALPPIGLLFL
jgi:hypothetical protein